MSNVFRSFKKGERNQKDETATYAPEYPSPADAPPDFGLADLTKYRPNVLKSANRAADGFVLSLALAYNDLKSIDWTHYQVNQHRPSEPNTGAVAGQISGMTVWAMRMSMALVHELLNLIQRADEEGWLKSAEFEAALELLDPAVRPAWDALVAVAMESRATTYRLRQRSSGAT